MYYLYDLYYARPTKDYAGAFLADAKAQAEAGKLPDPPRRSVSVGNISSLRRRWLRPWAPST
jgi:hypothetical protein